MSDERGSFNLPEPLVDLTALHTLALRGSAIDIGALPPNLGKLQRLENLTLIHCNLSSLPAAITTLPRLESLDVSYNQLTTLQDGIGALPLLRKLHARGNQFSALPANLASLPLVVLSYPDHPLYRDCRYPSQHHVSVNDVQFQLGGAPTMWASVKRLFDAHSADDLMKQCMVDASTVTVFAHSMPAERSVSLGASKISGAPHWPKHLPHPSDENGLLPTFYAQINLAEIAALQPWLPRRGML